MFRLQTVPKCSGFRLNHGTIVPFVIHISTLAASTSAPGAAWSQEERLGSLPPLLSVQSDVTARRTSMRVHMHEAAVPVEQNMH